MGKLTRNTNRYAETKSYSQIFPEGEWHLGVAIKNGDTLKKGEWYLGRFSGRFRAPSFVSKKKPLAFKGDFSNLLCYLLEDPINSVEHYILSKKEGIWLDGAWDFVQNLRPIGNMYEGYSMITSFKEHLGLETVNFNIDILLYQYLGRIVEDFESSKLKGSK